MAKPTAEELGAALLWLRNVYDVGGGSIVDRAMNIKTIDDLLLGEDEVNTWVTLADYRDFCEKRLRLTEVEVGQMFIETRQGRKGKALNTPLVIRRGPSIKE
jgi:hypothetical protein